MISCTLALLVLLAVATASSPTPSPDTCNPSSPTNTCPTSQCVYYTPAPNAEKGCCNNCCSTSSCGTNFGGTNNDPNCAVSGCCSCTYPSTCSGTSSKKMGYVTVSSASNCAADQKYANMVCVENGSGNSVTYKICENILYPGKTYYPTSAPTYKPSTFKPTYKPTTARPTTEPSFQPSNPTYEPTEAPSEVPTGVPTGVPTLAPVNSTSLSKSSDAPLIGHVVASKEFSAAYIFAGVVFFCALIFYYIDSKFSDVWVFQCDLTNPNNDLISFVNFKDDIGNILLSIKPNVGSLSINLSHQIRNAASHDTRVRLSESSISSAVGDAGDVMPHNCNLQVTVRVKWGYFIITSSAIESNIFIYKNRTKCRNRVARVETSVNWTSANIKPGKTNTILMYVYPNHDKLLMASHKSVDGTWSSEVKSLGIDFPIPENGTVEIAKSEFYYSVVLNTSNVHKVECDYFIPLSVVSDKGGDKYDVLKSEDMHDKHSHDNHHSKMFDSISISKTLYDNDSAFSCCKRTEYHYNLYCGTNADTIEHRTPSYNSDYSNIRVGARTTFELEPVLATATILQSAPLYTTSAADVKINMDEPYATSLSTTSAPTMSAPTMSAKLPVWVRQLKAVEKEFHTDEP